MKLIEIVADADYLDTLTGIAKQQQAHDHWCGPQDADGRIALRMLVADDKRQSVLDALQAVLDTNTNARIAVLPVEVVLPKPEEQQERNTKGVTTGVTREELYNNIEKGARLDANYLLLVLLSTVVAAIGLLEDNVAVVVGAMVIAPLLGPNLALALAAALGDTALMIKSTATASVGLLLALCLSALIGFSWTGSLDSHEITIRTTVNLESVALALASGTAAVLSLTTGLPSVLVGVMVAVALLPPTATAGLMLGAQQYHAAIGAGLLLAVNIVSVNLSAKLTFLYRGVKPRTWLEQKRARQSLILYFLIWAVSLVILIAAIYLRRQIPSLA